MPQSLARVLVHVVFSTKNREAFLLDAAVRGELHAYLVTVLDSLECPSLAINSVEDHIHILCALSRKIPIMKLIEEIKTSTSKWLKTKGPTYRWFYWQSGYGAFSVSQSHVDQVRQYIAGQEQPHRKVTFQDELREFLRRYEVDYDERHIWD